MSRIPARTEMMWALAGVALGALFAPLGATADAVGVEIEEWAVPWERTRPRDPYVAPDGRVWFCGQTGHYLAVLDPKTGDFERYELDDPTGPHNLIVAPDGAVWYAGNLAGHIGRLDPESGEIVKYPMPREAARDPHTLVFDAAGDIWFTVQRGSFVGRLDVDSGEVSLIEVPGERARPYGIIVDGDDRPWFVPFGRNRLALIERQTMTLREFELPRPGARPRRLSATSDGAIWYVDYAEGYLGRLDPESGEIEEWAMPSGSGSRPYAMAVDDQDRLWFVETGPQPNRFVGFDPDSEEFSAATEIASGAGSVRHMYFHQPTRSIWFGTDANTVGRAKLP